MQAEWAPRTNPSNQVVLQEENFQVLAELPEALYPLNVLLVERDLLRNARGGELSLTG